ncbi:MAG: SPOR domain-containing protein [Candidatus Accumulibacter sp.]|jgi:cell division septation protein DedD|nr:SPOR domain-containing protein [Accumulibacter sp.]
MRVLVFLLIPVNLLFFLWAGDYFRASGQEPSRLHAQILPDRVKIISRDKPPLMPVRMPKVPEIPAEQPVAQRTSEWERPSGKTCLTLDNLQTVEVTRVETLLSKNFPEFRAERTQAAVKSNFWVFIPPLSSRQEAERKVGELKRLNVPEFFVIQEPGPRRFAISLGIFSSRDAAMERLALLQEKGLHSAIVGERARQPSSISLAIHGPETQSGPLRQALKNALSRKVLHSCPPPVT